MERLCKFYNQWMNLEESYQTWLENIGEGTPYTFFLRALSLLKVMISKK